MQRVSLFAVRTLSVLVIGWTGLVHAGNADTAIREANNALRSAQSAMFAGKGEESAQQLDKAAGLVAEIEKSDRQHVQLPGLKQKLDKQRADLDKRSSRKGAAGATTAPATGTVAAAPGGKLPGGVTSRIKKIDQVLAKATDTLRKDSVVSTEWRRKTAAGQLAEAREILAEIERGYGARIPGDSPEMTAVRDRIAATEKEVAGLGEGMAAADAQKQAAQAQRQTQSAAWLARFDPYIDFYGDKRLLTEPTSTVANLKGQVVFRDEAKALLNEYGNAAFPGGKTEELEQAAAKLAGALKDFPANYDRSLAQVMAMPRNELTRLDEDLTAKLKSAGAALPVDNDVIAALRRQATDLGEVLAPGAAEVKELLSRIAGLEKKNAELRQRWVANALMKKDAYAGADAAALKTKANALVRKAQADATILRSAVVKDDWSEEQVTEWTDTTRTALRHRITRYLTAQVAAKRNKETLLYTLHLAQDRKADGTWGDTYGHVMFTDPMLEKNVSRTAAD